MQACLLCPRRCGVFREETPGYCGEGEALRLAAASIHWGEEPPLTGGSNGGGSGTVFVSGCNLGCVFCQNRQISLYSLGKTVDTEEFVRICRTLQDRGAENINIVTGSHAVPALVSGITAARAGGLTIPVLWNSSAYELSETLELLSGTVEVFLPDMKTLDRGIAARYCNAPDYPEAARAAIEKMISLRPLAFDHRDRLVSGVMVRHLVLPGCLEDTREVLHWFADHCAGRALLSLMFQYTPLGAGPDRFSSAKEYQTVLDWLSEYGIEDGYCQEPVPDNMDWLPDFEKANPFPSNLSRPVWHWREGFL